MKNALLFATAALSIVFTAPAFADALDAAHIIVGNVKGAERESGVLDKGVRATTGISVKDIKEHGILGGSNSIFHNPLGNFFGG